MKKRKAGPVMTGPEKARAIARNDRVYAKALKVHEREPGLSPRQVFLKAGATESMTRQLYQRWQKDGKPSMRRPDGGPRRQKTQPELVRVEIPPPPQSVKAVVISGDPDSVSRTLGSLFGGER